MGLVFPVVLTVAAGLAFGDTGSSDWRLELLKEEGISRDPAKLREIQEGFSLSRERVVAAVHKLGAEEFKVRGAITSAFRSERSVRFSTRAIRVGDSVSSRPTATADSRPTPRWDSIRLPVRSSG